MGAVHAKSFRFHSAEDVPEAVHVLARASDPAVLAGGQSLVPALRSRRRQPDLVVDIGRIAALHTIEVDRHATIVAGAAARQSDVLIAARRSGHGLLAAALDSIGTPLTRRRGTIGGIVAQGDPSLQLAAVCAVLDPAVTVHGPGHVRELAASTLFTGRPLRPDEVVTAVTFRACAAGEGWGFSPLALRRTGPQLAGAAARIALDPDGGCASVRLAAYTRGHPGGELTEAAALLSGVRPEPAAIAAAARAAAARAGAVSDVLATAAYRRHALQILIRRALEQAAARARAAGVSSGM